MHHFLTTGLRTAPDRAIEALGNTLSPADRRVLQRTDAAEFLITTSLEGARQGVQGWAYDNWLLNRPWGFSLESIPASTPVTLWWGDQDPAAPTTSGEALARQIPHATFKVIEGYGHFGLMFDRIGDLLLALSA
jgi:pimeloyl-ACP methyl ester carboxylesterase